MIGAIIGDIIGSEFERGGKKNYDFTMFSPTCSFTDDTVLTVATAKTLLENGNYAQNYRVLAATYPHAGYGSSFKKWMASFREGPYNSWGNGSAMRVSPVAYAFDSLDRILDEAKKTAEVTHNHPEGIKGAQAIAACIYLGRTGKTKSEIKTYIEEKFGYNLYGNVDTIRPLYKFEVSCQKSVPESIICFLDSNDYESAVRNAVSLGGDTDTMACMAGCIAEAFYKKIPQEFIEHGLSYLDKKLIQIIRDFGAQYTLPTTI